MNCDDIQDLIEPWATGEVLPSPEAAAHLRTCVRCQQACVLASQIQQVLADDGAITAPAGFTDRVVRKTHRSQWWLTPEFAQTAYGVVSSGALVAAGAAIWMSLSDGPLEASSLPVAVAAVAVGMSGLAWLWSDDPPGLDLRLRLSDFRPY